MKTARPGVTSTEPSLGTQVELEQENHEKALLSEDLKRKLQDARKKLGMSQSQFAAKLGMPVKTLQGWERDQSTPRGFTLTALEEKLAEILADK